MNTLLSLFVDNLLPILLIAASGFLLGHWLNIDPRSLSRVVFYIFSPCLFFDLLINSQLSSNDMFRIMGFAVVQMFLIGLIAWLIARALKLDQVTTAAVLLTTIFMNAGNFGLSLNFFAYGKDALAHASIFFVTMALFAYTGGVAIASLGSASIPQTLRELIKVPTIYAAVIAALFITQNWQLPIALERTTSLLSDATIPAMLVVLGLQLQKMKRTWEWRTLAIAVSLRLIAAPLLAFVTASLFALQGTAFQAGVTEASMPSAVITIVLATEYNIKPTFVTTIVFASTLLSPLTLTPLMSILGA
ncbi:MAG: AEC family transporter [Anaerolineae bacterium]|nr:AEC family transporter [Anaerolineae bacterium]